MFKLFLTAAFLATLLVSNAIIQSVDIEEEEVAEREPMVNARKMIKHIKAHAKPAHSRPAATKNLRSNAMKTAETDAGNYVLFTHFRGNDCHSPVVAQTVYVHANPTTIVEDDGTVSGYSTFTCFDGNVYLDVCDDANCASINSFTLVSHTAGQCDTSDAVSERAFIAECISEKAFFRNFVNREALMGFTSAADATANNLRKAQYYAFDYDLNQVFPLPKEERMECNEDLTSPGICVDTSKTKSVAYFAQTFSSAYVNLYNRFKGLGTSVAVLYEEGNLPVAGTSEVETWRYFVRGFYEDHFNYEEFST